MKNVIHILLFAIFCAILLILTIIPKLLVCLWKWESLLNTNPYTKNNYFMALHDLVGSIITVPE